MKYDWMPINTAPKDKKVLVWMECKPKENAGGAAFTAILDSGDGVWYAAGPEYNDGTYVDMRYEPTFWMPLDQPNQSVA